MSAKSISTKVVFVPEYLYRRLGESPMKVTNIEYRDIEATTTLVNRIVGVTGHLFLNLSDVVNEDDFRETTYSDNLRLANIIEVYETGNEPCYVNVEGKKMGNTLVICCGEEFYDLIKYSPKLFDSFLKEDYTEITMDFLEKVAKLLFKYSSDEKVTDNEFLEGYIYYKLRYRNKKFLGL